MKKIFFKIAIAVILLSLLLLVSCNKSNNECIHENLILSTHGATCEDEGYILHRCSDCGSEYKSDITPPKGHSLNAQVVAPTCSAEGYTLYSCDCGYSFKSDHVSPTGHTLSSETVSPTCVDQGYTENLCSVCGYSFTSDYTKPTGHDFVSTVTRPTSTSAGSTKFVCHCEYEYTGDYVMSSDIFKGAYVDGEEALAHGIDISSWNGTINWQEIKDAGIDFVIIKAGSTNGNDEYFEQNYAGAKAAGLDVGCYFYTYATTVDGISADADSFMDMIAGKKFEYPVYLDIEDDSQESLDKALLTEMCVTFIEKLQLNGYFGAIYSNNNWLVNLLNTQTITTYFDVWLARWTLSGEANWGSSFGTRTGIWQYTAEGTIGSHDCYFDMNIAFKDYPTLIKEWGYNGY